MCYTDRRPETGASSLWWTPFRRHFGMPPLRRRRMPLLSTLSSRILVLALATVSAVGQIAYLDALYWHRLGWAERMAGTMDTGTLAVIGTDALVSVLAAVAAVSLVFRRDPGRGGRSLAVAVAAWAYLLAYGGVFRLLAPTTESAFRFAFEAHFLVVECLGLAGILAFSAAFPSRLTAADIERAERLPVALRALFAFRSWLLRPTAPWVAAAVLTASVLGLARVFGTPTVEAPLNPVMDVARFATLAGAVINLRSSWDARNAEGRKRITWMVVGLTLLLGALVLLIGGNVLISVTEWRSPLNWRPLLLNLGLLGLLWGSAMAVFYEGRLDPKAMVRGTATWTGLATIFLFLSAGLEALFSDAMLARISLPEGVGTLAAICLFAWIFQATRKVVEVVIDQVWAAGLPEDVRA